MIPSFDRSSTADSFQTATSSSAHIPGYYPPTPLNERSGFGDVTPTQEKKESDVLPPVREDSSSDLYHAGLAQADQGIDEEAQTTPTIRKDTKEWLDAPKGRFKEDLPPSQGTPLLDDQVSKRQIPNDVDRKDSAPANTAFEGLPVSEKEGAPLHPSRTEFLTSHNMPEPILDPIPLPDQSRMTQVEARSVSTQSQSQALDQKPFSNLRPTSNLDAIKKQELDLIPRATYTVSGPAFEEMQRTQSVSSSPSVPAGILKNPTGHNATQSHHTAAIVGTGAALAAPAYLQHQKRNSVAGSQRGSPTMARSDTVTSSSRPVSVAEYKRQNILDNFIGVPDPTQTYIRPNEPAELQEVSDLNRGRSLRGVLGAPIGMDDQRALTPKPHSIRKFGSQNTQDEDVPITFEDSNRLEDNNRSQTTLGRPQSVRSRQPLINGSQAGYRNSRAGSVRSRAVSTRSRMSTIPDNPIFIPLPKNRKRLLPDNPMWNKPSSSRKSSRWFSWLPISPWEKTHRRYSSLPESRPGSVYLRDDLSRAGSIRSRAPSRAVSTRSNRSRLSRRSGLPQHPFTPSVRRNQSVRSVRSASRQSVGRAQSVIPEEEYAAPTSERPRSILSRQSLAREERFPAADNASYRSPTINSQQPQSILKNGRTHENGHAAGGEPTYRYYQDSTERPLPIQRGESGFAPN